jgi:hypothetical protein
MRLVNFQEDPGSPFFMFSVPTYFPYSRSRSYPDSDPILWKKNQNLNVMQPHSLTHSLTHPVRQSVSPTFPHCPPPLVSIQCFHRGTNWEQRLARQVPRICDSRNRRCRLFKFLNFNPRRDAQDFNRKSKYSYSYKTIGCILTKRHRTGSIKKASLRFDWKFWNDVGNIIGKNSPMCQNSKGHLLRSSVGGRKRSVSSMQRAWEGAFSSHLFNTATSLRIVTPQLKPSDLSTFNSLGSCSLWYFLHWVKIQISGNLNSEF